MKRVCWAVVVMAAGCQQAAPTPLNPWHEYLEARQLLELEIQARFDIETKFSGADDEKAKLLARAEERLQRAQKRVIDVEKLLPTP